jgi:hypothetical protein
MLILPLVAAVAFALVSDGAASQDPKNGCKSLTANSGDLISPSFSLAGATSAQVQFQSWWEIEAVDPAAHDLMTVSYSTDGGAHWTSAGQLNPADDPPNAQPFQDLTNNGFQAPASWQPYTFDLLGAAGQPNVMLRFHFDTRDRFYNGFRGWLLDNVVVSAAAQTVLSEDFESGAAGWTMSGFWHVQRHPETISVSPQINPTLVTLPDGGRLPAAFAGTNVAWYGQAATGTYCGADALAPAPPVLGQSFDVSPGTGTVFVKVPGTASDQLVKGNGFVALTQGRQLPMGTQVDARRGTLQLVAATSNVQHIGNLQTATLSGGVFQVTQIRKGSDAGLTTLRLLEDSFAGSPSFKPCSAQAASDNPLAETAVSRRILQTLHASESRGRFRTRGRFSAGTVRGTQWTTTDRCDGTLTVVQRGAVSVFDFGLRTTILVHAGHSYLAREGAHPAPANPQCTTVGDHDCDGDDTPAAVDAQVARLNQGL